jgi:hypothetical protein
LTSEVSHFVPQRRAGLHVAEACRHKRDQLEEGSADGQVKRCVREVEREGSEVGNKGRLVTGSEKITYVAMSCKEIESYCADGLRGGLVGKVQALIAKGKSNLQALKSHDMQKQTLVGL